MRRSGQDTAIVLLSAAGKMFRQETARRFAKLERVVLICGRYEGVDERVAEHLATDEISIGDFVLSGGELPAAMILDAVTRLIPGALGNEDSIVNESFSERSAPNDRARQGVSPAQPPDFAPSASIRGSRATNRGILGLSALHAPAFVSRLGRAGSIARREPRRDPQVAARTCAWRRPGAIVPTCSDGAPGLALRIAGCWMRLRASARARSEINAAITLAQWRVDQECTLLWQKPG